MNKKKKENKEILQFQLLILNNRNKNYLNEKKYIYIPFEIIFINKIKILSEK